MTIHLFLTPPSRSASDVRTWLGEPPPIPLSRNHFAGLIKDMRRDFYALPTSLRRKWRTIVREQIRDVQMLAPRYFR